ncbi:MAG TPA: hypothetical protein VF834_06490 [Streptosporangiaceae bacterium]
MPVEHSPAVPGPDEFDRQLRDLTSGASGAPKFREPSAQERAMHPAGPAGPFVKMNRRNARKASKLRRPVTSAGQAVSRPARRRGRLRLVGGTADRGRSAPSSRRSRLRSAARTAGILIAFAALLVLLHALGLGPH